jgi:hypothetical protein
MANNVVDTICVRANEMGNDKKASGVMLSGGGCGCGGK